MKEKNDTYYGFSDPPCYTTDRVKIRRAFWKAKDILDKSAKELEKKLEENPQLASDIVEVTEKANYCEENEND